MKPPEPFTWFVERSLGTKLVTLLGEAGFKMEHHATHFEPETTRASDLSTRASDLTSFAAHECPIEAHRS